MEAAPKLPLEEAAKIQEALKPLGYVVEGYCDRYCTETNLTVLYLSFNSIFARKDAAFSANGPQSVE